MAAIDKEDFRTPSGVHRIVVKVDQRSKNATRLGLAVIVLGALHEAGFFKMLRKVLGWE